MKIVINNCHGGFSISPDYFERLGMKHPYDDISRCDPTLIQLIEADGAERVGGQHAELKIVEIPDDVEWEIEEYDGLEWVSEVHRTWS